MSTLHFFQTILEIAAIGFVIWGYFNQDKLVSFETKVKAFFKRRKLKLAETDNTVNRHCA